MNSKNVIIGCLGVLLLASVAAALYIRQSDGERIKELESQLGTLRKQEEQASVNEAVSQQMERIAYGQQVLSAERSREAIRQSEIAHEMTLRSETERKKALEAQAAAEASAAEAMESYQLAEHQRSVAEHQRSVAEHAKMVADTLNYISLARTLGSQSYAISRSGDTELGNMLAYVSYLFTSDYGGDPYTPSVFQALTQAAGGRHYWSIHNGRISGMAINPQDGSLLTVGTYGEFKVHKIHGNQLQTTRVADNRSYTFRKVYAANNGNSYAISHTGHLVFADGGQTREIFLEKVSKPFSIEPMNDGQQLLIVGENSVALFDVATGRVIGTRRLDFSVICTGTDGRRPLLFDNRGRMHLVNSLDRMTSTKIPVSGQLTAFACSKDGRQKAYGTADGNIWLDNGNGKTLKLSGHLSKVTKLEFNGRQLYSSSYDGKLLFWMTGVAQIKPITLFQTDSWLTCFTFSIDKDYILTGDYNGIVTRYLISLPQIAQRLRKSVKRNFTKEEWNYYVGKGIPYREMIRGN